MNVPAQHRGAGTRSAKVTAVYDRNVVPGIEPPTSAVLHDSVVGALAALAHTVANGIDAVRHKPTTEAIHGLRVAILKLRNGLRVFPEAWPDMETSALDRDLHWLRSRLAASRDWDLLLQDRALWLNADLTSAPQLRTSAAAQRLRAKDRVAAVVRTTRCENLEDRLDRLALPSTNPVIRAQGGRAALRAAERQFESVVARKHACRERAGDFHRLRKAVRRLRYTCQLLEGSYGHTAASYLKLLEGLQRELGRISDATVSLDRLRELERQAGEPHGALRHMRERLKRRRRHHADELQQAWHAFRHAQRFWHTPD